MTIKEIIFGKKKVEKKEKKVKEKKVKAKKRYDNNLPKPITGHYSQKEKEIKDVIRKIFRDYKFSTCYIGATKDLDTRWAKYPDWTLKHVLYETTSFESAKTVEKELIAYVKKAKLSCNKDNHSKGLTDRAPKYYIYILADSKCKLRK